MNKKSAVEYLMQHASYADVPIAEIITFIISNNGKYSLPEQKALFESLFQSNISNTKSLISSNSLFKVSERKVNEDIIINNIKHVNGVNALQENQKINFSDSLTVIYGLNGSGKSGYFRILNELVGAEIEKDILRNIYSKETDDFKVEINFCKNGEQKSVGWTHNDSRGIKELKNVKVFDSHYFPNYIENRSVASILLEHKFVKTP